MRLLSQIASFVPKYLRRSAKAIVVLEIYIQLYTEVVFRKDGLMKGYNMIARIIMSEHPNEKDLEHFTSDHKDAVKDGFLANTQFSISVQTSPTSLLVISGYENQSSADSNLLARQQWFDERKGKYIDTFYYEGEIKTMMRGGGNHMLSGEIQVSSNSNTSQTDVIRDEVRDLRNEVSELKEMIKMLTDKTSH